MIEIKHRETDEVLHQVNADTLIGADLSGKDLRGAMLFNLDLSKANLSSTRLDRAVMVHTTLTGANLFNVSLMEANVKNADLRGVDARRSNLHYADFTFSEMNDAILIGSMLTGVNLTLTNLRGADLTHAALNEARLNHTDLTEANLTGAIFHETYITNCPTFVAANGLAEIEHRGWSCLDHQTLRACANRLPDVFLQGVGYTNEEIENLRALYRPGIQFYSCFISYARVNSDFAERLHNDLVAKNVTCWRDVHDMKGGDFWRRQINEAIRKHDKLIVVCSQASLARPEVVEEIIEAIEYERNARTQKLFPVRLDGFLFTKEAETLAYETLPARQRREDWLTYLRDYHVPDFSRWKNHDTYQAEFQKLLRDLKNPAKR